MSMICYVGQVTDQQIERIKEEPKRAELLVNEGRYFEEPVKRSFFQKLFGKKEESEHPPDPSYRAEPVCDLDKSWHALHFLFTGYPEGGQFPLNFLATGGEEIGEDMGYGPLRFLNSGETKILKTELDKLSVSDFKTRFDPAALAKFELYPVYDGWTNEDISWLADFYKSIKDFIGDAVAGNKGIYVYIF